MGWLRKSNFADKIDEAVQLSTARQLGRILINTKSCLYSQWFPGDFNTVSDSLARDLSLPADTLSHILSTFVPEQKPFGIKILPLPTEIDSWLTCLLGNQLQREPWSKEQQPSKLVLGIDTNGTFSQLDYTTIGSLTTSPEGQSTPSLVHLHSQSERVNIAQGILSKSNLKQSDPPWRAWHRPTSWLTNQIKDLTEMGS